MDSDAIDPTNPVVALCAEGMMSGRTPAEARSLFERAWAACRDDYDAAIAAHYLAGIQPTPADCLHWNAIAVRHAEAVPDGRAAPFLASLYLNLGDAQANAGDLEAAAVSARLAADHLVALPSTGYRDLVAMGVRRLATRVNSTADMAGTIGGA